MTEPLDALTDPDVSEVGLQAGAQCGKSEIGLGWLGWSIEHSPADFLLAQPDKAMAQDFVVRRINPMVARSAVLKAQLLPAANADNIFLKQFRGMLLSTIWPVASQFRARPIPRGWLDDFDEFDDDIEGQGSAVKLLDGRQTTFEGRDTKFVSSSPARPDGGGIEAFVEAGTDERLQPVCPSCSERIELDLKRDLKFDEGTIDEAEASAHVICPANGCILEPEHRRAVLDSLADLPAKGFVAANKRAGTKRRTFRVDGLLGFTSWPKLAREWREAQMAWALRQDENPLRAFFNAKAGKNYRSQLAGEKPLDAADLGKRREKGWKLGTVPIGPKVLVTVVDVQADRFECATIGYGEGLESWLIDRWSIEALADGLTVVSPFQHPEHWQVLLPLWSRGYPLIDARGTATGQTVTALSVAIDTGGLDKAAEGAKRTWHAATQMGIHPSRVTLLKGSNRPTGKLMPPAQFAEQKIKGGPRKRGPKLWMPNVHAIKEIEDARLRRETPGPGYVHLPGNLAEHHLDEITAEARDLKGLWKKLRPRNETWDLLVYGYASILKPPFAQTRDHMRWVPRDFRVPKAAMVEAKAADEAAKTDSAEAEQVPAKAVARRRPPARRGKNWMARLK